MDVSRTFLSAPSKHAQNTSIRSKANSQKFVPSESFEDIENMRRTIKEYREYYDPKSISWNNYIHEIFSILGFSVTTINPRLAILNVIGTNSAPDALVVFIHPEDNIEDIAPGLTWDSYLLFAATFYQIDWGILTNGLQMKVVKYQDHRIERTYNWIDFEEAISSENSMTFSSIFNTFTLIKQSSSRIEVSTDNLAEDSFGNKDLDSNQKIILVHEFLRQLLEKANKKTQLHANAKLLMHSRITVSAGKKSMTYSYVVYWKKSRVDLYFNDNKEWNKEQFALFYQHKDEIEARFGGPLVWELLPNRKASRIKYEISDYGVKDRERWDELQDQLIDAMIRFEKAFRPIIKSNR